MDLRRGALTEVISSIVICRKVISAGVVEAKPAIEVSRTDSHVNRLIEAGIGAEE